MNPKSLELLADRQDADRRSSVLNKHTGHRAPRLGLRRFKRLPAA
jgi:hypothetical protein